MDLERVDARPAPRRVSREPWHAVAIVAPDGACDAARRLKGIRFLSADAPRLPLPTCAAGHTCICIYRHFRDRRAAPRRAAERIGLPTPARDRDERRGRRGRRETDA